MQPVQVPDEVLFAEPVAKKPLFPHPEIPKERISKILKVSRKDYLTAILKSTQENSINI